MQGGRERPVALQPRALPSAPIKTAVRPLRMVPADQCATQLEERLVDIGPPLVAHLQPPIAGEPRQRPLDHPPMPTQPFAGLEAAPGDARGYAPLPERLAAPGEVVSCVGMQLLRPLARASTRFTDRPDGVHELFERLGVVDVGSRVDRRERDAVSVDHKVALGARFALVSRVRPGLLAPRGRARSPSPAKLAPSQSRLPCQDGPRAFFGAGSTPRPRATP